MVVLVYGLATGFCALHCGLTLAEIYANPEKAFDTLTKTAGEFLWQDLPRMSYAAMGAWEFGGDVKWPSGEFSQAPMVTRKPVSTEADVDRLQVPDVKTAGILPFSMQFYKLASRERLDNQPFNVTFIAGSAFKMAANISGPEKLA